MLVKTQSERIVEYWDMIRHALIEGMPSMSAKVDVEKVAINILELAQAGAVDIWMLGDNGKLYAIMTTVPTYDAISGTRALIVYSLYGYRLTPTELWQEAFETLSVYAASIGCQNISAFTDTKAVVSIAKKLNFSIINFITKEV